jgi:hypothetical protein
LLCLPLCFVFCPVGIRAEESFPDCGDVIILWWHHHSLVTSSFSGDVDIYDVMHETAFLSCCFSVDLAGGSY